MSFLSSLTFLCSSWSTVLCLWDTSGIRMLSAQSNRFFFLITSSVIGGSKIYSELQHTIKNPGALVLFVLYHSHSFIDVYLQGYKTASIIFSSSERQCCSFSWVGRYLFVGKTISPELPRAFPLHLSGQPYTNITGKRHAITMIDLN